MNKDRSEPAMLLPLLVQEVFSIAAHGCLPDGDEVNVPTRLWAEEWHRRLSQRTEMDERTKTIDSIVRNKGGTWAAVAAAYDAGQAVERERWRQAVEPALTASEGELPHAIYVLAGFARA